VDTHSEERTWTDHCLEDIGQGSPDDLDVALPGMSWDLLEALIPRMLFYCTVAQAYQTTGCSC